MRYIDEYRDEKIARGILDAIRREATRPWTIMEVCGGQTHTIVKFGLESLLPERIRLVHGPGCPVCVTPLEQIDKAIAIASRPDVIFTSFGDMLRVPGSEKDLLTVRAEGGDVRMLYSPLDALRIAEANPQRKVVFFAVGFETTVPATAMAVHEADRRGIANFSILCAHVRVPPAIGAILSSGNCVIQAFLAAGHVCTVMGCEEYGPIASRFGVPIVVTGFEPVDILLGVLGALRQLESGRAEVENRYPRSVREEGNLPARALMERVYGVTGRNWRGIGEIPESGYRLRPEFERFDAEKIFEVSAMQVRESPDCIAGLVLQGVKRPRDCPAFGGRCTPESPLGAPMVSSEGACAAYYQYAGHDAGPSYEETGHGP